MTITVASSNKANYDSTPPAIVTKPSGVVEGDLLIAIAAGKSNNPTALTVSGFVAIGDIGSGGESARMFYKVATGSEPSTYSFAASDTEITSGIVLRITGWNSGQTLNNFSSQHVNNGIFTTMDLTPNAADSLIVFSCFNFPDGETTLGFAIATSNPSWTVAQIVPFGFSTGENGVAWAVRPETTSTGDFSVTDTGGAQLGMALIITSALPANLKTVDTVAAANIKTIDGVAIANVKTINTVV